MAKQRIKLSEQIRRAVDDCGLTRYAISKQTGIDQSTLSRFMSGERGLPMNTLDILADAIGLCIVAGRKASAKRTTRQTGGKRKQRATKGR